MTPLQTTLKSAFQGIKGVKYENPVVTKELRTRMRGAKAHWLMMGYVVLLGTCLMITYYSQWIVTGGQFSPDSWVNTRFGFRLFSALTWCQAIVIALIVPSLTAGSLTLEREQQTIEMLSLTALSARNIVAGKITSAMLFILMLLACSLPLSGICLMFGSISPLEILVTYLMLIAWAFLFSSIGVYFSAVSKKTSGASLAAFGTIGMYTWFTTGFAASSMYGGADIAFAGLSACTAASLSVSMAEVFGVSIPVALVGILLNVSIGLLLLTSATTQIPYHREQRSVHIRLLILGIFLVNMFLFVGNVFASLGVYNTQDLIHAAFIVLMVSIFPFISVFSTGPHRKDISLWKQLFSGRWKIKIFENRPVGGFWFLIAWWIIGCIAILICISIAAPGVVLTVFHRPATQPGVDQINELDAIFQIAVGILGSVIAFTSIGLLASTIVPNRQSAAAILLLVMVLAWMGYPILAWQTENSYDFTWGKAHGLKWQLTYFYPYLPIKAALGEWKPGSNAPYLLTSPKTTWVGCAVAWGIVSIAALSLANLLNKRKLGIPDDR